MLSVAQAVHHSETPGSTTTHSTLGHSWVPERNMIKRRKTDSDCYTVEDTIATSPLEDITKHFNFNSQEVTLTVISKNSSEHINEHNNFDDLLTGAIKANPLVDQTEITVVNKETEEKKENKIPNNLSPKLASFLENSAEVQLTKVGKIDNKKIVPDNVINDYDRSIVQESVVNAEECEEDNLEHRKKSPITNCISELSSEVTIEPCKGIFSANYTEASSSLAGEMTKKSTLQSRLAKAHDLLKKSNANNINTYKIFTEKVEKTRIIEKDVDDIYDFDKSDYLLKSNKKPHYDNFGKSNSVFDDEPQQYVSSSVSDYESFNIGIPCETYYANKDRPPHTVGFPNPPGENRCWINATLQALFSLPTINKTDVLDTSECSKLMTSLISVQNYWQKGITDTSRFDQVFQTFKEELSTLDSFYSSKAQQDVSEFVMNLLNFIKNEFDKCLKKETRNSEIENIPNNDQDTQWKTSITIAESNKRLPFTDISASTGQLRNNQSTTSNAVDSSNNKTNSSLSTSKNDVNINQKLNPIDDIFSFDIVESYTCDGCSKERQQKVENLMLFLDLPSEDHGTTINLIDMIRSMFASEQRDITCESCKHGNHSMVSNFKTLPKILIVQVKRYEMTKEGAILKKCTSLEIPTLLRLDSLTMNNNKELNYCPEYEPVCLISHIGENIDSGHYVSFVKHENKWFYYDDSNVKVLSDEEVFKSTKTSAYVIFFRDTKFNQSTETVIN